MKRSVLVRHNIPFITKHKCKRCSAKLCRRTRKSDGEQFYGCSMYPSCTYTENYYALVEGCECEDEDLDSYDEDIDRSLEGDEYLDEDLDPLFIDVFGELF